MVYVISDGIEDVPCQFISFFCSKDLHLDQAIRLQEVDRGIIVTIPYLCRLQRCDEDSPPIMEYLDEIDIRVSPMLIGSRGVFAPPMWCFPAYVPDATERPHDDWLRVA